MEERQTTPPAGKIIFTDLTVEHAEVTRDFFKQVIGWTHEDVAMGDYADYMMKASDGVPAAGICHQAGENKGLPPVWLVYFGVHDLNASLEACKKLGGVIHTELKGEVKTGSFAVIEYPEGAFCALSQL
ncbi:VOC family protein [Planomicrobium sp. CPCC 101079]|uniref:VOC family protein n=1 Tax=Planomicrobium sp. CPCC 101079 TaxID=2599618 RepID=UPI0011B6CD2C|nr:VOC family protein [Planomicrobium sp. CPCC 101079]TWT03620.1 VOC family protein [Planomicrobium sp. CPCC 101079]